MNELFWAWFVKHPDQVTTVVAVVWLVVCGVIALWPAHTLPQQRANHNLALLTAVAGVVVILALIALSENFFVAAGILKGILP